MYLKQRIIEKNLNFSDAQQKALYLIMKHFQGKHVDQISQFQGNIYYKKEIDDITFLFGRKTAIGQTKMFLIPKKSRLYNQISSSFHRKYCYYGPCC